MVLKKCSESQFSLFYEDYYKQPVSTKPMDSFKLSVNASTFMLYLTLHGVPYSNELLTVAVNVTDKLLTQACRSSFCCTSLQVGSPTQSPSEAWCTDYIRYWLTGATAPGTELTLNLLHFFSSVAWGGLTLASGDPCLSCEIRTVLPDSLDGDED